MVKGIKQLNAREGNRKLRVSESEEGEGRDAQNGKKNANTSKKRVMMGFNMETLVHSFRSGRLHCSMQPNAVTHCAFPVVYTNVIHLTFSSYAKKSGCLK